MADENLVLHVNEPIRRCQNLLNISNEFRVTFLESLETEIRKVLDTFDAKYYEYNDRENPFTHMSKDEDGFTLIYNTDARI